MSPRTIKVLIGVLAALAVYVLLVEHPFTDDIRGPARKKSLLFKAFDPPAATSIEIRVPGRVARLEKQSGAWVDVSEGGFPADQKAVTEMLARIDTMAAGPVASTNPDKRSIFGVDSTGVEVRMSGGDQTLLHFWVGRSTADFSGLYLRLDGKNDVYSIPGVTRYMFDRGAQTWRERKIVPYDAELVRKVTVAWGDTTVTMTREGTDSLMTARWTAAGTRPGEPAAPARQNEARLLAQTVAGLTADGFPAATDTIPANWAPLTLKLDVEATGGDRTTVEVGPKNRAGQYYARRSAHPNEVYLLGTWRLVRLKKKYGEMVEAGAAPGGAAAGGTAVAPPGAPVPGKK